MVKDAPEHMSTEYTQLNVPLIGFTLEVVGMSMGAVAVHEFIVLCWFDTRPLLLLA